MGWVQAAGREKNAGGPRDAHFYYSIFTRGVGSREREPRSLAITKPAWAPKASAIRKKNAKEAEKQPRGRTGCAKPASPSSRYWRTGRGGRRTPTLMMLDESEEGAGEEDGD